MQISKGQSSKGITFMAPFFVHPDLTGQKSQGTAFMASFFVHPDCTGKHSKGTGFVHRSPPAFIHPDFHEAKSFVRNCSRLILCIHISQGKIPKGYHPYLHPYFTKGYHSLIVASFVLHSYFTGLNHKEISFIQWSRLLFLCPYLAGRNHKKLLLMFAD